jgi:hypothetical protein
VSTAHPPCRRPHPCQPKPGDLPADLSVRVGDRWAEIDACADAVIAYWDTLPRGGEPNQKGYGTWAAGMPYPAPSRFHQHGGFTAVRNLARKKRRAARPAASTS